jgi:hypothetical protein
MNIFRYVVYHSFRNDVIKHFRNIIMSYSNKDMSIMNIFKIYLFP